MTTTDVFARYAALDPAKEPERASDWPAIDTVLLATIDGRTTDVSTELQPQKDQPRTDQPRWRTAWVAAGAFALVILAGVAILLATNTNNDQDVVDDPPEVVENSLTPPFETGRDAVVAWVTAVETGTAEDIQALMGDAYSGFEIAGETVAETDERIRFARAAGVSMELTDQCVDNSPTSTTCDVVVTSPIHALYTGVEEAPSSMTVRLDEEGYISSTSLQAGPDFVAEYDLGEEFVAWLGAKGVSLLEIDPTADGNAQLDISPEEAWDRFSAEFDLFLESRNG